MGCLVSSLSSVIVIIVAFDTSVSACLFAPESAMVLYFCLFRGLLLVYFSLLLLTPCNVLFPAQNSIHVGFVCVIYCPWYKLYIYSVYYHDDQPYVCYRAIHECAYLHDCMTAWPLLLYKQDLFDHYHAAVIGQCYLHNVRHIHNAYRTMHYYCMLQTR